MSGGDMNVQKIIQNAKTNGADYLQQIQATIGRAESVHARLIQALTDNAPAEKTREIFAELERYINAMDKQIDRAKLKKNREVIQQKLKELRNKLIELQSSANFRKLTPEQQEKINNWIEMLRKKLASLGEGAEAGEETQPTQPESGGQSESSESSASLIDTSKNGYSSVA